MAELKDKLREDVRRRYSVIGPSVRTWNMLGDDFIERLMESTSKSMTRRSSLDSGDSTRSAMTFWTPSIGGRLTSSLGNMTGPFNGPVRRRVTIYVVSYVSTSFPHCFDSFILLQLLA
jgi:hypothetical protein